MLSSPAITMTELAGDTGVKGRVGVQGLKEGQGVQGLKEEWGYKG